MGDIFLVVYKDTAYIEGYVTTHKEFMDWLYNHNKNRLKSGDRVEHAQEFELTKLKKL